MEHTQSCIRANNEMYMALADVPAEDRYAGDSAYHCSCGLERLAREHVEMKALLERMLDCLEFEHKAILWKEVVPETRKLLAKINEGK